MKNTMKKVAMLAAVLPLLASPALALQPVQLNLEDQLPGVSAPEDAVVGSVVHQNGQDRNGKSYTDIYMVAPDGNLHHVGRFAGSK
ncbi:hypothetical protein FJU08_00870 [Martelella alba]|uniref:Uncharacterized protein n=1 Tax=Martelella alba TaxID=2590451 RepID=A0A506UIL2_9HYPH|nr:hypothetical protein [Martelella alba]TPW33150.1 hypothetical protein FJU08_00870 [Martelella alba]